MSEKVNVPWIDEPVELSEAVEMIAQADEDDEDAIQDLAARVDRLERRIAALEDGTSIECPSCDDEQEVYKAGVGAAILAGKDALSDANADALNKDSHVCIDCRKSFTPTFG